MTNPITTSAPRLRLALSITLALLVIICAAATVAGLSYIKKFSQEVSEIVKTADSSSERIDAIKQQLAEYDRLSDAVDLAGQVVAKRESYQYQNSAYRDLLAIANRAGVTIEQYAFESGDTSQASGKSAATPDAEPETSSTVSDSSGSGSSLKPVNITITLQNPVNYKRFLNFLYYIEQNLTKMQIKSISLSSANSEDGPDAVNTDSLTVEVYTR